MEADKVIALLVEIERQCASVRTRLEEQQRVARKQDRDRLNRELHERLIGMPLDSLAAKILGLHAPVERNPNNVCVGCENNEADSCQPDWPCATYRAAAEHIGVVFLADADNDVLLGIGQAQTNSTTAPTTEGPKP